jgi:GTP-binding protein EngB required for normal cell division
MDCRRGVTALDRQLLDFIPPHQRVLVLLTKSDKLGNAERSRTLASVKQSLDDIVRHLNLTLTAFSANTGLGVESVRALLESWVVEAGEPVP